MKTYTPILLPVLVTGAMTFAQNNVKHVKMEVQANQEAETQLANSYEKIIHARNEVTKAIEKIKDKKKRDRYKSLFDKNEKAWDNLILTTTMLQEPLVDESNEQDVRYTRILDANYSEFRIKQYHEFVIRILMTSD